MRLRGSLAFKLGETVDAYWVRLIELRVEAFLLSVESIVGRNCDQQCVLSSARCCQKFRPASVCQSRVIGISLAPIHVSPRSAVEKNVGTFSIQSTLNRRMVCDVQRCMIEARNAGASTQALTNQCASNHSSGPCDNYLHHLPASIPYCLA